MSKLKQEATPEQIDAQCEEVLQTLKSRGEEARKSNDSIGFLRIALETPPYDTTREDLKFKYVSLVHQALQTFNPDKANDEIFTKLSETENLTLFDYMNKSFEFIAQGNKYPLAYPSKVNSTFLLKLFTEFTKNLGRLVIIRGVSRKKTLVSKLDTWSYE